MSVYGHIGRSRDLRRFGIPGDFQTGDELGDDFILVLVHKLFQPMHFRSTRISAAIEM